MDLAASVQKVLEEIVLRITRSLAAETGIGNLCLAGGVALNCVANGRILRDGAFPKPLDTAGRGRRGRRSGAPCPLTMPSPPNHASFQVRRIPCRALILARLPPDRNRNAPPGRRRPVSRLGRREPAFHLRGGADLRRRPGLVSRKNGIRPESAGRALHPRRRAIYQDPVSAQSQSQIPGVFPAVRSVGAPRARGGLV